MRKRAVIELYINFLVFFCSSHMCLVAGSVTGFGHVWHPFSCLSKSGYRNFRHVFTSLWLVHWVTFLVFSSASPLRALSLLLLPYCLWVFHTSVYWLSFTRVWVIASPQIFWTLFSVLVDLNNDVVWMVSILPQIYQFLHCFIIILLFACFYTNVCWLSFTGV